MSKWTRLNKQTNKVLKSKENSLTNKQRKFEKKNYQDYRSFDEREEERKKKRA